MGTQARRRGARHPGARDRLYLGSDDNFFYSLSANDGVVRWRWRTGADVVGAPVADARRVYFTSLDNVLRALDLGSGAAALEACAAGQTEHRSGARRRNPDRVRPVAKCSGISGQGRCPRRRGPTGGLLAGPPHVVEVAAVPMPLIVYVNRSLDKGVTLAAVTRNVEPAITPIAPLPNPVPGPPTLLLPEPAAEKPSTDGRDH